MTAVIRWFSSKERVWSHQSDRPTSTPGCRPRLPSERVLCCGPRRCYFLRPAMRKRPKSEASLRRQRERQNERYQTDPDFRERMKAYSRDRRARTTLDAKGRKQCNDRRRLYLAQRRVDPVRGPSYRTMVQKHTRLYRQRHPDRKAARRAKERAMPVERGERKAITSLYVWARSTPNVRCYLCARRIPKGKRHVDHVTPLSKGGSHRLFNLAVLCASCNLKKGVLSPRQVGLLL